MIMLSHLITPAVTVEAFLAIVDGWLAALDGALIELERLRRHNRFLSADYAATLPPIEQRAPHHEFKWIADDSDRDYDEEYGPGWYQLWETPSIPSKGTRALRAAIAFLKGVRANASSECDRIVTETARPPELLDGPSRDFTHQFRIAPWEVRQLREALTALGVEEYL